MDETINTTEQVILALKEGRPISAMSARQTFGVKNFEGLIWNIRIRGHRLVKRTSWGMSKLDGSMIPFIEYRLREEGNVEADVSDGTEEGTAEDGEVFEEAPLRDGDPSAPDIG